MHRAYAIFVRQLYLTRSSPTRFINIFTWILIDVFLWGFISKYLNAVGGQLDFTTIFLGAVVLWSFLSQMQRGFILAGLEDVYTRNYLNLFASPLRVGEYLFGLVLSALVTSLFAIALVFILCSLVFRFSLFSFGFALVPSVLTMLIFGTALGVVATAIVLRLGPSGEWLAWPIPAIISPFVGVFYPIDVLPHWMQYVSAALPPSYVFEEMRSLVVNGTFDMGMAWIGVGISLLYLIAASIIFLSVYRFALRHGLIARYSAESYSS